MKRVLITGSSGYLGGRFADLLERLSGVDRVVGLDVNPPRRKGAKFLFVRKDVREPMTALLKAHQIDTVVHAAWILPPLHDRKFMESVNLDGTRNVLRSSAEAGVSRLVHCSSTTAYGFHPDNPPVLTEESPLRGNAEFTYSKNKREAEELCARFRQSHPEVGLLVLRPCFVCGPGFENPMSRHLEKKVVLLPRRSAPLQYVHEDDLVEAVRLLLEQEKSGVYNIAADGTISFVDMVRMLGNRPLLVPESVMRPLTAAAWILRIRRLTEFPPEALSMLCYPWIAGNHKLKRDTGFQFRFTSREAFEDYARHMRARAAGGRQPSEVPGQA